MMIDDVVVVVVSMLLTPALAWIVRFFDSFLFTRFADQYSA